MIAAIIFPYDIICDDFMEKMGTIVRLTEKELRQKKILGESTEEDGDEEQHNLFEGEGPEEDEA